MKDITITAEQVEKMLKKRDKAEKKWRLARESYDYARMDKVARELNAIEQLLDIMGIEY